MELFGVAIVVLLVGITLLVLWRSARGNRTLRTRAPNRESSGRPMPTPELDRRGRR